MELDISTPALLFPAITLLLLAYTNRFLALATLIRGLHSEYQKNNDLKLVVDQINNLRKRLNLVRRMQAMGVLSFLLTVACMIALFQKSHIIANYLFGASLVSLLISLTFSLIEIQISTRALNIELSDMEDAR
ncbi:MULTISPECIES: DUF2721 domain-containing protein [Reichenbachiella]|uniref:II family cellulose-binding protein n=1 Tax=Reichenbachiella agariperforans TaxID=156994 RepID=A0A1M6LTC8_REIAG|nr:MULTISPECIES: DUF2721 domain-containing protein [Reichenbachiella]MBU2914041.1 DUF2721 domain-containing protein [Reichenbachiella agariperforans]RJE74053.1 II family cellulose-binding protein [Reichenbachiella sp. MSK19-1]SHJ74376.1 Protein of unknown function [Reichenbachiella agariperforans]